jgi:hypothetical protein
MRAIAVLAFVASTALHGYCDIPGTPPTAVQDHWEITYEYSGQYGSGTAWAQTPQGASRGETVLGAPGRTEGSSAGSITVRATWVSQPAQGAPTPAPEKVTLMIVAEAAANFPLWPLGGGRNSTPPPGVSMSVENGFGDETTSGAGLSMWGKHLVTLPVTNGQATVGRGIRFGANQCRSG